MMNDFQQLSQRVREIESLKSILKLLQWDQNVYMPLAAEASRAQQLSSLGQIIHSLSTDSALGSMLNKLEAYESNLPPDSDEARLIRVARHDYERALHLPVPFVEKMYSHLSESYQAWLRARTANEFKLVQPYLERSVELSREYASYFPKYQHISDPLIASQDEGFTSATICKLFQNLRERILPLVQAALSNGQEISSRYGTRFPATSQVQFGLALMRQLGFDFGAGRQDISPHPFSEKMAPGDVRSTTRIDANDVSLGILNTLHEFGHAIYSQRIDSSIEGTCLDGPPSMSLDESQARMWENVIGRSLNFWQHFYPVLQAAFPTQLDATTLKDFYRSINRVSPSFIRADADELTYNLHIIMRFDFEQALLEGKLAVQDLPEAWNERFREDWGLVPPTHNDGVLQDVHWYESLIGGQFQGYAIGTILSAQIFEAALQSNQEILTDIAKGEFSNLLDWLTHNIYRHGRKFSTEELVVRVTDRPLTVEPYVRYLHTKFGPLYGIHSD
jgi:carboxypeptidase Taq